MKIEFSPNALECFQTIKDVDPEKAGRIKTILKDALQHPKEGLGDPVALDGKLKGLWQRKISYNEYLYYVFDAESLVVVAVRVNLPEEPTDNTPSFKLGEFSKDDYASVMALMAANRGKDLEPKVGLFWYNRVTNTLFGVVSHRLSDYTKANASDGRITCSEMHEDVWKKEYRKQKYQNNGVGPFIGAYQDKPRGRVFYNINTDTFEVAVGKWMEEFPQAYQLVLEEFNLPSDRSKPIYAVHWDIGMSWR
ncbi:MAG: type II toxin-antitoxin system YoeB family toxin [Bacteroides sp.]|nr:type II toxin-antitoxin system YoeB family toxin [Bacteroides sp.]